MLFLFSTKNILLIVAGIILLGSFISTSDGTFTGDFWNESITGSNFVYPITKIIYDRVSENAVITFTCIDEKTGSVIGYSAFDAEIGNLKCSDV